MEPEALEGWWLVALWGVGCVAWPSWSEGWRAAAWWVVDVVGARVRPSFRRGVGPFRWPSLPAWVPPLGPSPKWQSVAWLACDVVVDGALSSAYSSRRTGVKLSVASSRRRAAGVGRLRRCAVWRPASPCRRPSSLGSCEGVGAGERVKPQQVRECATVPNEPLLLPRHPCRHLVGDRLVHDGEHRVGCSVHQREWPRVAARLARRPLTWPSCAGGRRPAVAAPERTRHKALAVSFARRSAAEMRSAAGAGMRAPPTGSICVGAMALASASLVGRWRNTGPNSPGGLGTRRCVGALAHAVHRPGRLLHRRRGGSVRSIGVSCAAPRETSICDSERRPARRRLS